IVVVHHPLFNRFEGHFFTRHFTTFNQNAANADVCFVVFPCVRKVLQRIIIFKMHIATALHFHHKRVNTIWRITKH
ncbi:hypothetical protein D047_2386B, partial [Vibrio parahaemolyticus VPTS-2010_2]